MFDELSPQDFAFKARDVMNKNLLLSGQKRYNADYYAVQRIQQYIKQHTADSKLHSRVVKVIPRALLLLTPYSEEAAFTLREIADDCFECFNKIIMDYIQNVMLESQIPGFMSSALLQTFEKFQSNSYRNRSSSGKRSKLTTAQSIGGSNYSYNNRSNNESVAADGEKMDADKTYSDNEENERDEEEEEEEEEEFDSNEYAVPVAQMSLQLRQALGLENIGEEDDRILRMANSSNWIAPAKHGLGNSAALMKAAEYKAPWTTAIINTTITTSAERSVRSIYNSTENISGSNSINSDDDDDDDDYEYDGNEYEIPVAQMSMSLRRALGLVTAAEEAAEAAQQHSGGSNSNSSSSRWQAPKSHGLSNSAPIFEAMNYQSRWYPSNSTISQTSTATTVTGRATVPITAADDEEEEEDDEDGDHGIDDDHIPTGAMSLGLMKALGLDTSGMEEVSTDWKPPEHTGLQHSKPIVQTHGNSSSGGGNHKAKSPTHRHRSPSSAARAQELQSRSYSNQSSFPVIGNRTRP